VSAADRRWAAVVVPLVVAALVLGAVVAPPDAVQGEAQRLMYLHVPAAWCAYVCFLGVLVASLRFLARGTARADQLARAAAEGGIVLTALTLATGSVWGRATWGTWWVWDARVTTTVAMGLVYVGYLATRAVADGPAGRRVAAVVGTLGFVVVPVVHFSVLWWRTLHQPPTVLAPTLEVPLDGRLAVALATALLATTATTGWLVFRRWSALVDHEASAEGAGPDHDLVERAGAVP
jgi:heme exporter protein C